jgi:hypothetical protein
MSNAYPPPLQWPYGWQRTDKQARLYGGKFGPVSFAEAYVKLQDELRRLEAGNVVISCDRCEDERDGRDPGVAVYFTRNGQQLVIPCDRYRSSAHNLRSIGLAIQAMRQLERHGGSPMMDRAFTGFVALPAPQSCLEVLGVKQGASEDEIHRAWRLKAKEAHRDNGGSNDAMARLNKARDEALGL